MTAVWDYKSNFEKYRNLDDVFDCLLAESLLTLGRPVPDIAEVYKKYKTEELSVLMDKQLKEFEKFPKLKKLFFDIEMRLIPVLVSMEMKGIVLDKKRLSDIEKELTNLLSKKEEKIIKEIGYDINIASPSQVGEYLAEKLGVGLSKTKTGKYATNENELSKHAPLFPIIGEILEFREMSKLLSTYTSTLSEKADSANRIHTTYSMIGVNTGRLSSSNPNLQNIPVGSEIGLKIKSCFAAEDGSILIAFDYSQQELRVLAHLSGEKNLIDAFKNNLDIHTATASKLFNVAYEKVDKTQRSIAKTINFGIIYGMSSYGMSEGLQISVEEADKFIKSFYKSFPEIKNYYDKYISDGWKNDVVETMLGRRRYVKSYSQQKFLDNQTRRVLMNYPIQGSAAEIVKMAMIKIYDDIKDKDDISMILQIHDELVFEVKNSEEIIKKYAIEIKDMMENIYKLSVPIDVEIKIGDRWGEMEMYGD